MTFITAPKNAPLVLSQEDLTLTWASGQVLISICGPTLILTDVKRAFYYLHCVVFKRYMFLFLLFLLQSSITSRQTVGSHRAGWQGSIHLCLGHTDMSDCVNHERCSSEGSHMPSIQQLWHGMQNYVQYTINTDIQELGKEKVETGF